MICDDKLSSAIADAKKRGLLREQSNPLDMHHFVLYWLLGELQRLESRVAALESDEK